MPIEGSSGGSFPFSSGTLSEWRTASITPTPPPVEDDDLGDGVEYCDSCEEPIDDCTCAHTRCDDCGYIDCMCAEIARQRRTAYRDSLREYSADASTIIGFIPPRTQEVPTFTKESLVMDHATWLPLLKQHAKVLRQPYFGIELECYPRQSVSKAIHAFHEVMQDDVWMIFKRDSSVNEGMEIVTAPMTLAEHQKRWPTVQEVLRKHCRAWGLHNCGLHVHTSRGDNTYCWALSKLDVTKMVYFVHNRDNWQRLQALGGREATSYCKFTTGKEPLKVHKGRYGERSEALNLHKTPTLELRFFQGCTRVERILMTVEFAACLRQFVQQTSVAECKSYEAFTTLARANVKHYPHLVKYLGYTAEKKHDLAVIDEAHLSEGDIALMQQLMEQPTKDLALKEVYVLKGLLTLHDEAARNLHTSRKVLAKVRQLDKRLAEMKGPR